jgi:hypothetical protein
MKVTIGKSTHSRSVVDLTEEILDILHGDCSVEEYDKVRDKVIELAEKIGFVERWVEYDTDALSELP